MSETPATLPFADLETAYETIAETIDALPEDRERLFLAKLCLALAHRVGDPAQVDAAISEARENLEA
ncbi:DUF2783 domain-containing protein [Aquisalimonas lutea]|uniref:DUF2783 domain-containing protein n=1 Tax=Aquisalimonas lutea TaxID=1327750 RepID=UPI0025B48161|nr:DUF2783 domain-containing protein [Aquisalimonas lutea]MDN3518237.1 DUF2783 domain-containing protein [Aquisalimonas lutea]